MKRIYTALVGFSLFVGSLCFVGLTYAAQGNDQGIQTPASDKVENYTRSSGVGDFYISPNVAFGLTKLSKPSMTGYNLFMMLDIDHLSDGNLDVLNSETGFSFRSFEYGLGYVSVSKDDVDVTVFIPAQFLYKKSFGMQASRSGILSMFKFGIGPLVSTSIQMEANKALTADQIARSEKSKFKVDSWSFGLTLQAAYELSFPINYIAAVNVGVQWNFSLIDISGSMRVADVTSSGHLMYNAMNLYSGVRFSL